MTPREDLYSILATLSTPETVTYTTNGKSLTDINGIISTIIAKDSLLLAALTDIVEAKPKFADLFKGTFKEKLKVMCKGFATFAFVLLNKYKERYNITEDDIINMLAARMAVYIPQLPIPVIGGYISYKICKIICTFLITYALHYVKEESYITAIYQEAFETSISKGDI